MEDMEDWERLAKEAKAKKDFEKKWPLAGKRVKRKGRKKMEYGTIIVGRLFDNPNEDEEYFIEFDNGGSEQLFGLPFEIIE